MTPGAADMPLLQPYLRPDEHVLWLGAERMPRAATPIALAIGFVMVVAIVWYFWLSDPPFLDRCTVGGSRTCASIYYLGPPAVAAIWVSQFVQMVQHLLMRQGRARRLNVLTNRRFLRIATWPWVSLRSTEIAGTAPRKKYPSRLFFSRTQFYFLHPEEIEPVMALIAKAQTGEAA